MGLNPWRPPQVDGVRVAWVWGAVSPAKFLAAQQAMQAASSIGKPLASSVTISTSTSRGRTDGCDPAGANGQDQPLAGGIWPLVPSQWRPSSTTLREDVGLRLQLPSPESWDRCGGVDRRAPRARCTRAKGGGLWWNGVQRCQRTWMREPTWDEPGTRLLEPEDQTTRETGEISD